MDGTDRLQGLYDEHAQALFALLLNVTRNEADTRDILQEVFLKLAQRPTLLDGVDNPRGFLIRLACNRAIDLSRRHASRRKTHDQSAAEAPSVFEPDVHPDADAFRRILSDALAELPLDQRAVVHLKLWEDLTFKAIAEALDIPPNTAASRYRYGVDKLRERLRPLYEELKHHG